MGKPSLDPALAAYRSLIAARGELFGTPAGPAIEILTDEAEISTTQRAVQEARRRSGLAADDVRVGVLLDDPYLLVMRDAVRFPDGALGLYNRIVSSPNVVILPLLGDRVALIHRFRHGTRSFHYEAPRGIASGLDRLEDDARRELKEEIGADAVELIDLGELHPYSGICNEMMRLYLARITGVGAPELHEGITGIELFSVSALEAMIRDGVVTDAPTLAVTLRARLRNLL